MRNYRKPLQIIYILLVLLTIWLINPVMAGGGDQNAAKQAWPMIENGALLIDVRSKKEFEGGHLEGAVNIEWDQIDALAATIGSDKQRQVVLYCRSGNRVGKSIAILETKGYSNLFNATGLEALKATRP